MKRFTIPLIILLSFFIYGSVYGQTSEVPSITYTASARVFTGPGYFHGITVITDGTNSVTVDVYDGLTATGRKLIPTTVVTSSATDRSWAYNLYPPVRVTNGIYVNITVAGGGTASYMVYR